MPTKTFQAKQFKTRKDLEKSINSLLGSKKNDKKEKVDFVIKGKLADLKRLRLSTISSIFGVQIEEL